VLNSVILSFIIIRRGTAVIITTLSVLWSTSSSSSWSHAALLLTEPRMPILPCLFVLLKSWSIMLSLGSRLEPTILVSPHALLPYIQMGIHRLVLEVCPQESLTGNLENKLLIQIL
jgi:hypothetical protein